MAKKNIMRGAYNMPIEPDTVRRLALFLSLLKGDLSTLMKHGLVVRLAGFKSGKGLSVIAVLMASKECTLATSGKDFSINGVGVDDIVGGTPAPGKKVEGTPA